MLNRHVKTLYYLVTGKCSIFSMLWCRYFRSKRFFDMYVHIGCGTKYVKGMVNIDINILRRKDIWADITLGLPFSNKSIRGIYAHNVLEHFSVRHVTFILSECFRVLKKGGVFRIVVPSLERAIQMYNENRASLLGDWPENYSSIGGKFYNFMLCANQHYIMFDHTFLKELLGRAGFHECTIVEARKSSEFRDEHLINESDDPNDLSLHIECRKAS